MVRKWFNFKFTPPLFVKMMGLIVGTWLLLYVVSCGTGGSVLLPSRSASLDPIRSLTLDGVDESSITISWDLLKTKEGAVHPVIGYAVYAETPDEEGVFKKIPDTEAIYTLFFSVDLGNGGRSTVLPVDDTGRAVGITVRNLNNNTPYRIVVVANDASGNSSQARLLAYTVAHKSSALTDPKITGLVVSTALNSEEVTVTWDIKEGAQAYVIQATDGENQFGGDIPMDNVITIVCPPEFLLCEKPDQFAQEEGSKLKYILQVNHKGSRYKLAIIPFNFQDLIGLQAVDEEGLKNALIEEVLALVEDESSVVGERLKSTIQDPAKVQKVQVRMSVAEAATDLVLDSTGSTLSARWSHGTGAEYYYAILTSKDGNAVTNTIDRYESSGRFSGGGYVGFSNLIANTAYTVTVQSFTVSDDVINLGGEVLATLFTKDAPDTLDVPKKIANNLILDSGEGELWIDWYNEEANSVIGYNVFYWVGDTPSQPQYVAVKGETYLALTVPPDNYRVRIDVLSTYPGREVVTGDSKSIMVYGKPLAPKNLGIAFSQGIFTNINNKLYAIGYPLTYTEANTPAEAGGPVGDVSYLYRYRVEGGEWVGYSEIINDAMISLQVDDLSDEAMVKSGYGKKYQVEMVVSNAGGFVSDAGALEFAYKSFPEPFDQSDHLEVKAGDRSLTVTWPRVREVNGSTIVNYMVILNEDPYEEPVQSVTTVERKVVFKGLTNNQSYYITVIPNGTVTGNILNALSAVTGYTIGEAIGQDSKEEMILTVYTGAEASGPHTPQGSPGVVEGLEATDGVDLTRVTWGEPAIGSPATTYVLEYLLNITASITNIDIGGDAAAAELSGLSWRGASSVEVPANDTGSYSYEVDGLGMLFVTNVFRVRAVRVDDSGKEWLGEYRYYARVTDISRAPSSVGALRFFGYAESGDSFTVSWSKPTDPGRDTSGVAARLVGYKVSWGTTVEGDKGSIEIANSYVFTHTITRLTPSTQYYVKVQAKNDNTEGHIYNTGSIKSTYTVKPPGDVVASTITYSKHTTNSFKVSWDAVTDTGYGPEGKFPAVHYRIELSRGQGAAWQQITRSDSSATEEILTGLFPGTEYKVRIIAFNIVSGQPLNGNPVAGEATWTLSPPGQVGGLVVSDPDYDKTAHRGGFKVSWAAPSDTGLSSNGNEASLTGYEVTYAEVVEGTPKEHIFVTHEDLKTEYIFTGLKANAKYDIRIRARTAAGAGAENYIYAWTPSPPGAVAPSSITFSSSTASTIGIKWDAPEPGRGGGASSNNTVTLYKVELYPQGSGLYILVRDNYSDTTITATGLSKSTTYRARVTAKNTWGEAETSVSTTTESTIERDLNPPLPPKNLRQSGCAKLNSVALTWDASYRARYYQIREFRSGSGSGYWHIVENVVVGTAYTRIGLNHSTSYTYTVRACNDDGCSGDAVPLRVTTLSDKSFKGIIDSKRIPMGLTGYSENPNGCSTCSYLPADTSGYDEMSREIFSRYDRGAAIVAKYLKPGGSRDGSSFANAAGDPKDIIDKITDASDNKIYVVLLSGGTYKPKTMSMKKYVAIVGGVDECLNPSDTVTALDGERTRQLFYNDFDKHTGVNETALLYGVTIINGKGVKGGGMYNYGGGKGPYHISPSLVRVTFSGNEAEHGGGMYSEGASYPSLVGVTFSGNKATKSGGGMYNNYAFPRLDVVTFSGNTAKNGGGLANNISSPLLTGVTFSGNKATEFGGGMYNFDRSSPALVGVTFTKNDARKGGAVYIDTDTTGDPLIGLIVNGIFWDNTASVSGAEFYIHNDKGDDQQHLRVYDSIVKGGASRVISGRNPTSVNQGGFVFEASFNDPVMIYHNNIINANPGLGPLLPNGGPVLTHAISSSSPAVNQGMYTRFRCFVGISYCPNRISSENHLIRNIFYYSINKTTWYHYPDLSGDRVTPRTGINVQDLTAIDATGHTRTGRPDLGAYEAQ